MEVRSGTDVYLQAVKDPTPEKVYAQGCCDPVGSLHWSRLLAELVDLWREEPNLEQLRSGMMEQLWCPARVNPPLLSISHAAGTPVSPVQIADHGSPCEFVLRNRQEKDGLLALQDFHSLE
ncbi:hypothetical protein llap_10218 [Limosa lapponica baueri]|uniref:Uncharacterized protein n=1 Tax=Limosa lapponica baueri TaxID=1758121 RepID=A0A2I0U076_LIMLA|nr:hypothetical protein llap_10218 [Limosa lapponica baueri]